MYKAVFKQDPNEDVWTTDVKGTEADFQYRTANYVRYGCFQSVLKAHFDDDELDYKLTR